MSRGYFPGICPSAPTADHSPYFHVHILLIDIGRINMNMTLFEYKYNKNKNIKKHYKPFHCNTFRLKLVNAVSYHDKFDY